MINFNNLKKEGKSIIYKETESEINEVGWVFCGEKKTENEHVYVYRKIVTIEEAEQYELENELLD